jgi:hypothetical protein
MLVLDSDDGAEQFMLPVTPALRIASAEPEPLRAITAGTNEPEGIRPRDIQMRVRAGEDPQSIADESGTSLEKIMRFAYPVLQERIRVVDEARRSRARGAGGQVMLFGELAETGFAAHGIDASKIEWNALRRPDGGWSVLASVPGPRLDDDTPVLAKFSVVLTSRTVSALNDVAADLLSGHPIRALQPPPVYGPTTVNDTASSTSGASEFGASEFGARLAAVPSVVSEADVATDALDTLGVDEASRPDDTAPANGTPPTSRRQLRRLKARTHPVPIDAAEDEPFDRAAFAPTDWPESGWQEQALPLELPLAIETHPAPADSTRDDHADRAAQSETPGAHADTSERDDDPRPRRTGRAGDKPRMPSWDDILLGVRRKSE